MRRTFRLLAIVVFAGGYLFGTVSTTQAVPQFSFAGYHRNVSNRGVRADIGFKNPNVPTGQSVEWVMADDGGISKYIQIGWLKRSTDPAPLYFGEFGCAPAVCQQVGPGAPNGVSHLYQVNLNSANTEWVFRIDGAVQATTPWQNVGFQQTPRVLYEGETSDTAAQLGGTAASHLRMLNTAYSTAPGTWVQVNPNLFVSTTTPGTCYRASKGTAGASTFVDNWTINPPC